MEHAKVPCPNCGYGLDPSAPVCGNCGFDRTGKMVSGSVPSGSGGQDAPVTVQSGSDSPLASGIGFPWKLITFLVVAGVIAFFAYSLKDDVSKIVDDVQDGIEEFTSDINTGDGPLGGTLEEEPRTPGYPGVRAVVREINAGGLKCNDISIDAAGPPVESGSCQARVGEFPAHVQINVYLTQNTLDFATDTYRDSPFHHVHKDNAFVSSLRPVTKRIHGIIGGTFRAGI